jgi:hypothetical protein
MGGMLGHFKTSHARLFDLVAEASKQSKAEVTPTIDPVGIEAEDSSSARRLTEFWSSAQGWEGQGKKMAFDLKARQDLFDLLLTRAICLSCLPFSFIENPYMKAVYDLLSPGIQPKSRRTLTDTLIPKLRSFSSSTNAVGKKFWI